MIPESTLNQIQERVDIVEVISAHVQLRRSGKNFKACCPFHMEKTPSFMVNPDKQIFHCFGCSAGGNVFTFLMKIEKKDFREVVEAMAERAGIEIPDDRKIDPAADGKRQELLKANRLASEYFQRVLWNDASGKTPRAYLKERGLSEATLREFALGYAAESWDGLLTALKKEMPDKVLERAGLVLPGKEGKYYDRFRKRVMYPILDIKGQVVAFGGRVLDETQPKYLNSPETEIYTKGRHLYGLYQARTAIRTEDAVVMVEGYMDVIGCHQAGVTNVVASLGTALTGDQARLLKRHTSNVIILYDADAAGEAATLRGLEIFLEEGMDVRIVRLPDGHDPDTYILKHGLEAFRRELAQARNLFEYKIALLKTKYPADSMDGRVKIANEMVSLFSKVKNEIQRSAWTSELAKELGITEAALRAEIEKINAPKDRAPRMAEPARVEGAVPIKTAEKILLGLLLESADFTAQARRTLSGEDFGDPALRRVVERLFAAPETGPFRTAVWLNVFADDAEASRIVAMASAEAEKAPDKEKAFQDCLWWIERTRMEARRETLRAEIAQAHRTGDQNRIHRLLHDFSELNKGMKKSS